jgi:hypothetical protein
MDPVWISYPPHQSGVGDVAHEDNVTVLLVRLTAR